MGGNDKDGCYCSICGCVPPDKITTKPVIIDGKETGNDHLDWIFDEVNAGLDQPMILRLLKIS